MAELRILFPNGSLVFPPFSSDRYRHDVHATLYRCRLKSSLGVVLSREVHVKAGNVKLILLNVACKSFKINYLSSTIPVCDKNFIETFCIKRMNFDLNIPIRRFVLTYHANIFFY